MSRVSTLVLFVSFVSFVDSGTSARADPPAAAGAAVTRLMEAYRANDRAGILDAIAGDYDYDGLKKADLNPLGLFWVLPDHLVYRLLEVVATGPHGATALVDLTYTGHLNLDPVNLGEPAVAGTARWWIEVGQQPDGSWRVTAWRPVRSTYRNMQTPATSVGRVLVNGLPSVKVAPGAALAVTGVTEFSVLQEVTLGTAAVPISLHIDRNAQAFEPWSAALQAPAAPGRYFIDTSSLILTFDRQTRVVQFLSADEVTVPVVVE